MELSVERISGGYYQASEENSPSPDYPSEIETVGTPLPQKKYDIVVANILADVLVPLTPVIKNQLKPGGIYITSGIIEDKEQVVTDAVKAAGFEVSEVTHQGEWVSVTAQKAE